MASPGSWSPNLFGSVGEDGSACLWDSRLGGSGLGGAPAAPVQQWRAHGMKGRSGRPANGIAFSQLRPHVVATGGKDGMVRLWDIRGGSEGTSGSGGLPGTSGMLLKTLPSHHNTVTQLAWSPHRAGILASCDIRGLVYVWDMDTSGGTQAVAARSSRRAVQGPSAAPLPMRPELRMIYPGHAREVNDVSWCPDGDRGALVLATVSSAFEQEGEAVALQDANVQVWRPSADMFS